MLVCPGLALAQDDGSSGIAPRGSQPFRGAFRGKICLADDAGPCRHLVAGFAFDEAEIAAKADLADLIKLPLRGDSQSESDMRICPTRPSEAMSGAAA